MSKIKSIFFESKDGIEIIPLDKILYANIKRLKVDFNIQIDIILINNISLKYEENHVTEKSMKDSIKKLKNNLGY